jgi:hypothetical protein
MTTPSASAKDLITLAERMGIPVDEAMRQVAQVIADNEPPVVPPGPAAPVDVDSAVA